MCNTFIAHHSLPILILILTLTLSSSCTPTFIFTLRSILTFILTLSLLKGKNLSLSHPGTEFTKSLKSEGVADTIHLQKTRGLEPKLKTFPARVFWKKKTLRYRIWELNLQNL